MKTLNFLSLLLLISLTQLVLSQNQPEVIEDKIFTRGLSLKGKENLIIKNCQITNPDGRVGIELQNCKNIRIEQCVIRSIGNESLSGYISGSLLPKDAADYPQRRGKFYAKGIHLYNCISVTISDCDISDVFGQGIHNGGDDYTKTRAIRIEKCRIAYIYSDAIKFGVKNDQGNPKDVLPFMGGLSAIT